MTKSVRKRDGSLRDFEPDKIRIAISKAFSATVFEDPEASKELSGIIVNKIEQKFPNAIPPVEEIQDIVEHVLIEKGYVDVAKAYILYRQKRSEIRQLSMARNGMWDG
jgi:ribonucleoside-diphosphate reductase alpha chain